jgi:hypothetical protein
MIEIVVDQNEDTANAIYFNRGLLAASLCRKFQTATNGCDRAAYKWLSRVEEAMLAFIGQAQDRVTACCCL